MPDGTKPLLQAVLTYHQWSLVTITLGQFRNWIHQPSFTEISLKITHLKCHSYLPGANELCHRDQICIGDLINMACRLVRDKPLSEPNVFENAFCKMPTICLGLYVLMVTERFHFQWIAGLTFSLVIHMHFNVAYICQFRQQMWFYSEVTYPVNLITDSKRIILLSGYDTREIFTLAMCHISATTRLLKVEIMVLIIAFIFWVSWMPFSIKILAIMTNKSSHCNM